MPELERCGAATNPQSHAVSLDVLTRSQDHDKVKRTLDEFFNVKLETRDISLKGWNWGKADVLGERSAFQSAPMPLRHRRTMLC